MRLNELRLKGFRNLAETVYTPGEGVNVIYGENAQGKTNLLEAVWLFSGMRSFRGAKDQELIAFGAPFAKLKASFSNETRENRAELTLADKKTVLLNGVKLGGAAGMLGKFSAVVFAPSFLSIVKSGPEERRRFLDASVCQLKPAFAGAVTEFSRLLKQRNALLKDVAFESSLYDMLDVLDERLGAVGDKIVEERNNYLTRLIPQVDEIYTGLSGGREKIRLTYVGKTQASGGFGALLKKNRREDLLAKTTTGGPHRDDLEILIGGVSARAFGSQGQQRSAALALKFGESAVLLAETGEMPVILLDDVMSELDARRQDFILNHIRDRQVFITCCDPETVGRLTGGTKTRIEKGRVIPCT